MKQDDAIVRVAFTFQGDPVTVDLPYRSYFKPAAAAARAEASNMFGINLRIALKALAQNKLQALLTLCGMSVGVAMVVIVAGLGQGAQATIESQLESAGPTKITLRAGNFVPAGVITSGEQDSSGGEPSEGSDSPYDTNGPARRHEVRERPARQTKQRTPGRRRSATAS